MYRVRMYVNCKTWAPFMRSITFQSLKSCRNANPTILQLLRGAELSSFFRNKFTRNEMIVIISEKFYSGFRMFLTSLVYHWTSRISAVGRLHLRVTSSSIIRLADTLANDVVQFYILHFTTFYILHFPHSRSDFLRSFFFCRIIVIISTIPRISLCGHCYVAPLMTSLTIFMGIFVTWRLLDLILLSRSRVTVANGNREDDSRDLAYHVV